MSPSLRRRVINEWRGIPSDLPALDRLNPTSDLVPKVMQKLGLRERLHENQILAAWKNVVGEFIAGHSAPAALRNGVLYVHVIQPSLHYELDRVKADILRKLKQRFGPRVIHELRFRIG